MNSKDTCAKHQFLTNSPIEILFVPFERALWNLQTETLHFVIILCKKKNEGPLKFHPEPPSCSTTHGKNSQYKGNLCEAPVSNKFTYWNSVCTIWKSSMNSTDWNYSFCDYPVQKKLRAHWNLILNPCRAQRPMEKTVNTKETCAKRQFLTNPPIEMLIVPFERALWNLQTETIHFVIILCKKNWGPIEIWSWPPVVLNDPWKKQ